MKVPQRNLRSGGPFRSFQQSSGGAGDTTREATMQHVWEAPSGPLFGWNQSLLQMQARGTHG